MTPLLRGALLLALLGCAGCTGGTFVDLPLFPRSELLYLLGRPLSGF
jgi:hypothetical protein